MSVSVDKKTWTDEEFMALPGGRYELVNGDVLDVGNSGMEHGYVASILNILVGGYVLSQKLGVVCDSSTAFAMKTGNKRSPDFSLSLKNGFKVCDGYPKAFFKVRPILP